MGVSIFPGTYSVKNTHTLKSSNCHNLAQWPVALGPQGTAVGQSCSERESRVNRSAVKINPRSLEEHSRPPLAYALALA